MFADPVIVRHLGVCEYADIYEKMLTFNQSRDGNTPDEIWLLQHQPVYTLGLNGKVEHILNAHDIPVVNTDRGGQVTYHGPGQLIAYVLFDMRRNQLGVRQTVTALEQSVIALLASESISGYAKKDAPGVYVDEYKIAALGLRVKRGGCYHGISINVDMDLSPFNHINPCGYPDLKVTSMRQMGLGYNMDQFTQVYLPFLCQQFAINQIIEIHE
ncbi:MAG TPA: lipoyl(octanoyl) transferase LipB [Gammaproteobacteria bacterium]